MIPIDWHCLGRIDQRHHLFFLAEITFIFAPNGIFLLLARICAWTTVESVT